MNLDMPSVTVEAVDDSVFVIGLSTDAVEIHIFMDAVEAPKLSEVRGRRWELGALRIGRSLETPAWWSVEAEEEGRNLSIVFGDDDQSWGLALRFPLEAIDEIRRKVDTCPPPQGDE